MLGNVFKTGYARCTFTPTPPIGKFSSIHDDVYATCVAVNDGERVGIIGVNGAGKTSLFRCITGETRKRSYAPRKNTLV